MDRIEAQRLISKANNLKGKTVILESTSYIVKDFKMFCSSGGDGDHENCQVHAILETIPARKLKTIELNILLNILSID